MILLSDTLARFRDASTGGRSGTRVPLREYKVARVRLAILSAVVQLTLDRSLADISVREICEDAQVAPATFFNYFPSKEDVLVYYMRLWSIPLALRCRDAATGASSESPLATLKAVFDDTAAQMERAPRLMFEIIAYIAHAPALPQYPAITRAERLLAFPDLPGAEEVEPQSIDDLLTTVLTLAMGAGELPLGPSVDSAALALKALFYGVPLATRRDGVAGIRHAYRAALDLFLERLQKDGQDEHPAEVSREG
jgi:AcrR family transcriptional regulator